MFFLKYPFQGVRIFPHLRVGLPLKMLVYLINLVEFSINNRKVTSASHTSLMI